MSYFCVQSVEGREAWDKTKRLLEQSDLGNDYERLLHAPGETINEFFLRILQRMHDSGEEICVRFEDDLWGVNRHIKHNVETWPALTEGRFGCGWLMAPGGQFRRWQRGKLHCSVGIVLLRKDIPELIQRIAPMNLPQDIALSQAVADMGRDIAIHHPSLVAHDIQAVSLVGNRHTRADADGGTFREHFRR